MPPCRPSFAALLRRLAVAAVWLLSFSAPAATGIPLHPEGLGAYTAYGPAKAAATPVPVQGQPFSEALRIDTYGAPLNTGASGLEARLTGSAKKGDVLWISFKARRLQSQRETGEASFTLRLDALVNGVYQWPSHLERGISVGEAWTETSVPFALQKDISPADSRLVLQFDSYQQRYEVGPITVLNYGTAVSPAQLPRTVVRYGGDAPDAAWRQAAADRIEKHRKGELRVRVVDAGGQPLPDADVRVRMTRNAFHWGTAVNSPLILGTSADAAHYRDKLSRHFNHAVYENEAKAKHWHRQNPQAVGENLRKANQWLRAHGLGVRGHVFVWPSWQHSPHLLSLKDQPEALRKKIRDDITAQAEALAGEFDEWDVLNEPYAHHELITLLGKAEAVEWFRTARAQLPQVKLFLNDYTMFQGAGPGSPSQAFHDWAKYLKDSGAPIDAIGEQGHIGGTPPDIGAVIERLDHFGRLGLPIKITEFDINSNDDDYKARYLADFMTAIYSHPSTTGFIQWGFWEGSHWFPVAALWNRDWSIRKHGQAYVDLVTKTWWTDVAGKSDAAGALATRGYTGDYEITVTHGGRSVSKTVALDTRGQTVEIGF